MQIYFRDITLDDLSQRVEWINDPKIGGQMTFKHSVTLETTLNWFELNQKHKSRYHKIIVDAETDKAIGIVGLSEVDFKNSNTNLYIAIGDLAYRGRGVSKIALEMVLDYIFNTLKLNRAYAVITASNDASIKAFLSVGFLIEGTMRKHLLKDGKYIDRVMLALLNEDYLANLP